jgi:exodeoxyribonuclease V alpha subunit
VNRLDPLGTAARRFLRHCGDPRVDGAMCGQDPDSGDIEATYLGWEVARCATESSPSDRRVLAAIAAACIVSNRMGSTRLPLVGPSFATAMAAAGAAEETDPARRLIQRVRSNARDPVGTVIGRPGERKPLILDGEWLYAERMRALEDRFCARVRDRMSRGAEGCDARAVGRAIKAVGGETMTVEQKSAVRQALRSPLTLITGGPGTGKTTAVVAVVRAVAWLGVPPLDAVAIAAPTGKAAQRLSDAIATGLAAAAPYDISESALRGIMPSALTLHRLLGWSPQTGRFARHENDPLPHKLILVDEASMIDLAMMDRLVRALQHDARLVLLGDADQLPSVEAGAVFRDLCAALKAVRLTVNLRVGRDPIARRIVTAANAVNAGVLDAPFTAAVATRRSVADLEFEGVEHLDASWTQIGEKWLDRWWTIRMTDPGFRRLSSRTYRVKDGAFSADDAADLKALFAHYARARILCVTRVMGFDTSAEAINARLLMRLRGAPGHATRARWRRAREFAPGAPCIAERNDYARGLFNGDQGVVVRAEGDDAKGPCLMAAFARGSRFEAQALEAGGDLAPAFAMTVHKAQGSEFDDVALVLPDVDVPLLTRELVYTAMTRARRSVLVVGSAHLLARAVQRTASRYTGVAEKLDNIQ